MGPPFYATVMGTAGMGIAWRIASGLIGVPAIIGEAAVVLAFALFVLISLLFIAKCLLRPDSIVDLWKSNRNILFAPMIPTSLLLLSIGARPYDAGFATILWYIAAPLNLILAVVITGRWLFDDHELTEISPAWMFPVVGNGVVPIAGVPLGFVNAGWAFFSIGFVLWVVTFVALFSRLVLGDTLAKAARPTILILISPPATFFIAYSELTGARIDLFAYSMIYFSLFLLAVFLLNGEWVFYAPFSIASWSLTFPMAALTIAMLLFYRATGWALAQWVAAGLLGLTTLFVLSVMTLGLAASLRNLRPSPAI
jgi:tellurite resistance protein